MPSPRFHAATVAFALASFLAVPALSIAPVDARSIACVPDYSQHRHCNKRVVEVMFVLDTTGSMSGLIAGAKQKIWSIANEIVANDPNAIVRMGLIGYRDIGDAYVTKFHDLTTDIDGLYGKLLGFQANGGGDTPESVNQALYESVSRASWTPTRRGGDKTIRLVFLTGDAPPHMDYQQDIKYPQSMQMARDRGIKVNTLQAGRLHGTQRVWLEIARLGNGVYAQIPQNGNMQIVKTPYDQQIHKLQRRLEGTVIPYGEQRVRDAYRTKLETRRTVASPSTTADRAAYRATSVGKKEVITGGGDLLAEIASGTLSLEELDTSKLPKELKDISPSDRNAIVLQRTKERAAIDAELGDLLSKRGQFLKNHAAKAPRQDAFDSVIRESIRKAF